MGPHIIFRFLSCSLNWLTGGNWRQTFSARCYEAYVVMGMAGWRHAYSAVNYLLAFERHCRNAYFADLPHRTYV